MTFATVCSNDSGARAKLVSAARTRKGIYLGWAVCRGRQAVLVQFLGAPDLIADAVAPFGKLLAIAARSRPVYIRGVGRGRRRRNRCRSSRNNPIRGDVLQAELLEKPKP
jgi:hypothetical protein